MGVRPESSTTLPWIMRRAYGLAQQTARCPGPAKLTSGTTLGDRGGSGSRAQQALLLRAQLAPHLKGSRLASYPKRDTQEARNGKRNGAVLGGQTPYDHLEVLLELPSAVPVPCCLTMTCGGEPEV